jgi:hypothetical protein
MILVCPRAKDSMAMAMAFGKITPKAVRHRNRTPNKSGKPPNIP